MKLYIYVYVLEERETLKHLREIIQNKFDKIYTLGLKVHLFVSLFGKIFFF